MKLNDLLNSKQISLFHSAGYVSRVNANTPSVSHSYKVIYTTKNGKQVVIGQSRHSRKECARKQALNKALEWANS